MFYIPTNNDVVIIGAGPVGLMTANLLGLYGLKVLLIERNNQPYDVPRAITLDDEGCRTLQAVGLDDIYLPNALPSRGSRYYGENGEPFAEVGPGPVEYGFPRRTQIFQPEFEKTLLDGLSRFNNVTVRYGFKLVSFEQDVDKVDLTVLGPDGESFDVIASYLIGSDGARSTVRKILDIEMLGNTYPEDWLIIDTINDPDTEPVSKFFCSSQQPYVSIPAPNGGRRYEFRALREETSADLLHTPNIQARLKPIRDISQDDIIRVAIYTFEAKIAASWQTDRAFLLGDAAHVTPPFAGQGMNAGLRDAHNLSWKLSLVCKGQSGPSILQSYETERRGPCWAMIQLAVAMGDIVMPRDHSDITFRNSLVKWMDRFPAAREFITQMKFKPPPRYTDGIFVNLDDQEFTGSLVGQMLPQIPVKYLNGTHVKLDKILGHGFTLIVQDESTLEFLHQIKHQLWPELGCKIVAIGERLIAAPDNVIRLQPKSDTTVKQLRSHRDQIILIRPDRYVAASFDQYNYKQVIPKLSSLLS